MSPALCVVAAAGGLAVAGCGDDSDEGGPATTVREGRSERLSPGEAKVIALGQRAVADYCAEAADSFARGGRPSAAGYERATDALELSLEVAVRRPAAVMPDGSTAQLALSDLAEDLEGSNCDPRLVEQIDEGLAAQSGS